MISSLFSKWFLSLGLSAAAILGLNSSATTTATTTPSTNASATTTDANTLTAQELSTSLHDEITDLRNQIELNKLQTALPLVRPLLLGSRGPDVQELQNLLVQINLLTPDLATGYYGMATQKIISGLQTYYGLRSTGVVDRATADKIMSIAVANMDLGNQYFPEEAELLAVATSSEELLLEDKLSTGTPACDQVEPEIIYSCPLDAVVSASAPIVPATTLNVTGSNTAFSPKTLSVAQGTRVTIHFTVTTGTHNFIIDAFNAKVATTTSAHTNDATFTVGGPGSFQYYSSVGTDKASGMTGTLTVTP